MQHNVEMWGVAGLIVAGMWVILGLVVPISPQPILWGLARFTCPILPMSIAFHFGVKWYWFIASNVAAYAMIGLIVESLRQLRRRHPRAAR